MCSVRDILRATKQGAFESVLVYFLLLFSIQVQKERKENIDTFLRESMLDMKGRDGEEK